MSPLAIQLSINVAILIVGTLLGYIFGRARDFREQKQRVYSEILPILIRTVFHPGKGIEKDFNKSLAKLWLYANKNVARKIEKAMTAFHHPERKENLVKLLQEAIVEMRKDIQISPFQKLQPQDVNHFYTSFINPKETKQG